jgi:hypothetical protein
MCRVEVCMGMAVTAITVLSNRRYQSQYQRFLVVIVVNLQLHVRSRTRIHGLLQSGISRVR